MANIKRDGGELIQRDPFQAMREFMRWDPFRELTAGAVPALQLGGGPGWNPSFEVRENKDAFVFKADLPGVKAEDVKVTLTGHRLQIQAHRQEEKEAKDDTYYTFERAYGSCTRSFTLPDTADTEHVQSELKEGVLTLVVPKRAGAQTRTIAVSTATTKS
ncbi:MAG: Hsp20/alpha crystallin family protein [Deltaproteobacteria bacterium]|nr:Hsp20/alpha crystallin family protein [Deltaproteobacteria bacterium]